MHSDYGVIIEHGCYMHPARFKWLSDMERDMGGAHKQNKTFEVESVSNQEFCVLRHKSHCCMQTTICLRITQLLGWVKKKKKYKINK